MYKLLGTQSQIDYLFTPFPQKYIHPIPIPPTQPHLTHTKPTKNHFSPSLLPRPLTRRQLPLPPHNRIIPIFILSLLAHALLVTHAQSSNDHRHFAAVDQPEKSVDALPVPLRKRCGVIGLQ